MGEPLHVSAPQKTFVCLLVNSEGSGPAQLILQQPQDLEIRAFANSSPIVVDGFQFGPETLTIEKEGSYRIEIRAKSVSTHGIDTSIMSRSLSSLHPPSEWVEAERSSTLAKASGKLTDVEEAERLWRGIGDQDAVARTHLEQAVAVFRSGDYPVARRTFEEARTMCRMSSDLRCTAEAANNSGWTSRLLGDFDESLSRLTEALSAWRRLADKANEGRTLSNIGLLYWQGGEYQKAIATYVEAAPLVRYRDAQAYGWVLNNLGLCYMSLGEYTQSTLWLRRASAIAAAEKGGSSDSVLYHMNLGHVLMLRGHLEEAQQSLTRTLSEAERQPGIRTRAWVLDNLGQILWNRHLVGEAEAKLHEALELHRKAADKRGAATALHRLGLIARDRGDLSVAQDFLEQAVRIRTECALRDEAAESLAALADLQFSRGDFADARTSAGKGALLLESTRRDVPGPALRASYYSRKRKLLDLLVQIAMQPGTADAATEGILAAERGRGRSLLDSISERSTPESVSTRLIEEQASLRRRIELLSVQISTASGPNERELRNEVEFLLAESTQVDASIRDSIGDAGFGHPLESLKALCDILSPDSAILEYHLGEPRSYLWLVESTGVRSFELKPGNEIARHVARAVDLFGQVTQRQRAPAKQAEFEWVMSRLSGLILGPLRTIALPPRLILVPDGALHLLPFAALRVPGSREDLGLAHDLVQSSSATYLTVGRRPRPPAEFPFSVLAVADPVFQSDDLRVPPEARKQIEKVSGPDLARLPFMADLQTISELVPAPRRRVLKGFDANPATLRHLRLRDFAILHFSTHAIVDDEIPALSRIALSMVDRSGRPIDGFLRSDDLWDFRLEGSTIVLSACNTARGKLLMGEGLIGLTSSLFHAGAAQMVLSLTDLDAPASAEFFSETYRQVFGKYPVPMERALTIARRKFAASRSRSDPYYWASIVLIGRPSEAQASRTVK